MPRGNYKPIPQSESDNSNLNVETMRTSAALRTCKILCRLFSMIVARFWKLSTSACLVLLLVYWFYGGAVTFMFLMISIFGLFYYAQDMFLYYPQQPPNSRIYVESPAKFQLPYENVFVKTSDGVSLNMYFIKHQQSASYPTILMFHGNAGNIGHRSYVDVLCNEALLCRSQTLAKSKTCNRLVIAYYLYNMCRCNVVMPEYRGYGKSGGSPSESGLYKDAEAAFSWLRVRKDVDLQRIYVYGSSLGGAVSIKLASEPRNQSVIAGVILENTFTNLPDVARSLFHLKVIDFLPNFCFKNKFMSDCRIVKITIPTLFLSGQNDELIPPCMMSTLHNLSGSKQKLLVPFEGGTHNETYLCPGYYEAIAQFVHKGSEKGSTEQKESTTLDIGNIDNTII